ncbi:MAG: signal peptidase II [Acidobacteriota bacterium]
MSEVDAALTVERPSSSTLIAGVAAVVILDQLVKLAVVRMLPVYDSVTVIPHLLDLTYVRNTGVAFGVLNESSLPYKGAITTSLALIALGGIALYARQLQMHERWARRGLTLILGGAFGNLIDRLRLGYVVDFVDVYWHNWHFWAFNVADAAITFGAVFVFLDLFLGTRHASRSV